MSHKACSEKLNIILSRIPLNKFEDYKVATEQYFTTYRTRILKHLGNNKKYYKVLRYYIFGTSDIAYITLTESDKFSQKIFSPIISNENKLPLSYQIISGITQSCKNSSLEDSFNQLGNFNEDDDVFVEGKYKYSIICNLKLNPGYLLGGLLAFFESVEETINQIIKDHFETKTLEKEEEKNYQYIITRTFSWSDINLVLFANDLGKITSAIAKIRRCQFKDLNSKITDTLYHHFLEKENQDKIEGNHIFIETQTYFGVEFDYFRNGKIEESLKTQVECKVKPGHEKILFKNLKANKTICNSIDFDKIRFLYGTTDILLSEKNSSISNNQDIVKIIQEPEFSDHIRKIKTRIRVVYRLG